MTLFGAWRRRSRQPAFPPDSPSSLRASSSADAAGRAGRGRPVPSPAVRGLLAVSLLFALPAFWVPEDALAQTLPNVFWDGFVVDNVFLDSAVESVGTHSPPFNISRNLTADLDVNYSIGGTATCGTDYTIAGADCATNAGVFTIPSGTVAFTDVFFPIALVDDSEDDNGETIEITFTTGAGYNLGFGTILRVTVLQDTGAAVYTIRGFSGVPRVGDTLRAHEVTPDPDGPGPALVYIWEFRDPQDPEQLHFQNLRNPSPEPTFALTSSEEGKQIRLTVQYTDAVGFSHQAFAGPIGPVEEASPVPPPVSDPLVFSSAHISTNEPAACRDNAALEFGPVHATETYTVRLGSDPGGWARVTVFDPSDSRPRPAHGSTTPMRWGYAYKGRVTVTGDYPGYGSQRDDGWVTELRFGSSNWYVPQEVTVNIHCARHDSGYRNKIWHRLWDSHTTHFKGAPVFEDSDYVSTTVQVVDSAVPAEPADLSVASAYAGTLRPAIDTGTASPYPTPAGDEWEFQVSWSWETTAHPNDWWDASRHFSSFRTTVEADSSVTTPLEVSTYHEESDFVIDWDRTNNSAPYSETIWHTGLYYDRNSGANPGDPVYRLTFTPITARGSEVPGEAATICAQLQSPRATSPQAKKVVQVDCSLFVPQTANQVEATPPTLTIAADAAEIAEGGAVTFTVTADQAPGIDIAVNLGTSEEMGEGLNYVGFGQTGTVTIAADETSAAWTVTTYSDEVERADGTVTGRIKPSADYVLGEPSSVTLALLDDDGTDGGTADGGTTDGAKDGGAADGGTTDGAPEPPPVAQQSEPPGVDPALIAEVKAHIADFTARNHAMGIRDWTAILNRLEGRDGGMSDGDIAAWLDNANRHGWQDGIDTLPKVQAAALAAATQPADPTPVDPPADPPATPPPPPVPPADPPPTDPQPTDPPPTSAVDPALIAEVKAHVADFTARNHAMGIRDWDRDSEPAGRPGRRHGRRGHRRVAGAFATVRLARRHRYAAEGAGGTGGPGGGRLGDPARDSTDSGGGPGAGGGRPGDGRADPSRRGPRQPLAAGADGLRRGKLAGADADDGGGRRRERPPAQQPAVAADRRIAGGAGIDLGGGIRAAGRRFRATAGGCRGSGRRDASRRGARRALAAGIAHAREPLNKSQSFLSWRVRCWWGTIWVPGLTGCARWSN